MDSSPISVWASIASAIQSSIADYVAKNTTTALERLTETDETLEWIAENLNPNPTDKELTATVSISICNELELLPV